MQVYGFLRSVVADTKRPNNLAEYDVGDVCGYPLEFSLGDNVLPGRGMYLVDGTLQCSQQDLAVSLRLHIFNRPLTAAEAQADGDALNFPASLQDAYLGSVEFDTPHNVGAFSYGRIGSGSLVMALTPAQDKFGCVIEYREGDTPEANAVYRVDLRVEGQ